MGTETSLRRHAEDTAERLVALVSEFPKDVAAVLTPPKTLNLNALAEVVCFLLHMCDRVAFEALSSPDRALFIDHLVSRTIHEIAASFSRAMKRPDEAEKLRQFLFMTARDRQLEYAACKTQPAEGEGLRGTLLWEFTKRMAEELGYDPMSATVNTKVAIIVTSYFKALDLASRLTPST